MPIKFYIDQAKDLSTFLVDGPMRLDEHLKKKARFMALTKADIAETIQTDTD